LLTFAVCHDLLHRKSQQIDSSSKIMNSPKRRGSRGGGKGKKKGNGSRT